MPLFISTILLVLAVVLVVLTRMRLARDDQPAGRTAIPVNVVNAHTAVGGLAIVLWGAYLFTGIGWPVGFLGLLLWWVTTGIGLLILLRWMPARGRHASDGAQDDWTEGPWLSMVGHIGALVGAVIWTTFFALGSLT
jgi:hypothetical protein